MKPKCRAFPLALGCLAWPFALAAQTPAAADPPADRIPASPADVRQELIYLLRADARALRGQDHPAPAAAPPAGVVMLDPYVVRESKNPDLPTPHYESPVATFLRTGTVFTLVGEKTTQSLYFGIGDSAIPHSGAAAPAFRIELGWRISF